MGQKRAAHAKDWHIKAISAKFARLLRVRNCANKNPIPGQVACFFARVSLRSRQFGRWPNACAGAPHKRRAPVGAAAFLRSRQLALRPMAPTLSF